MGLSGRRAREAFRRAQQRAAGPTAGTDAARPRQNPWTFDVSELDGEDGLSGPGVFRFDVSELDGEDHLVGRSISWFILDVTPFGRGVLA